MNNSSNLPNSINNINNNINNIYNTLNIISNSMLMSQSHTMMNDLRRDDIRRQFLNTRMPDSNHFTTSNNRNPPREQSSVFNTLFRTSSSEPASSASSASSASAASLASAAERSSSAAERSSAAAERASLGQTHVPGIVQEPPLRGSTQTESLSSQRRDIRSIITSLLRNEIPNVRSMEISVMGIPRETDEINDDNIVISHHNVYNNTKIFNKIYDEDLDESEYEQCSICLETIKNNDIVREINKCKHCFHIGCSDKWFEEKITCPNCRQDIRIEIVN